MMAVPSGAAFLFLASRDAARLIDVALTQDSPTPDLLACVAAGERLARIRGAAGQPAQRL
jgi:hypothetical protein